MSRTEDVLTGLRRESMATALVARMEQTPARTAAGERTLRWSSAGHLRGLSPERLCDALLDRLITERTDDDIALLAVRCTPPTS